MRFRKSESEDDDSTAKIYLWPLSLFGAIEDLLNKRDPLIRKFNKKKKQRRHTTNMQKEYVPLNFLVKSYPNCNRKQYS